MRFNPFIICRWKSPIVAAEKSSKA